MAMVLTLGIISGKRFLASSMYVLTILRRMINVNTDKIKYRKFHRCLPLVRHLVLQLPLTHSSLMFLEFHHQQVTHPR